MEQPTRRARSAAAKHNRRDIILDTALALWNEQTFSSFAMADLASRCGLAKGTLYLYFATKEQLFLALLERELVAWFDALDTRVAQAAILTIPEATDLFSATLAAQPALIRLLPISATVLEHNISLDAAYSYKAMLLARATQSSERLEACLPFLTTGEGIWLLLQVYALTAGYGQMADPAPVVAEVLAQPEMKALIIDFDTAFRRTLQTILHGMQAERNLR
jgi:AcrR family transcriptional regulator